MVEVEKIFKEIVSELSVQAHVDEGKMMSSAGLQYKGKNFIFLWDDRMVFRLERDFDPGSEGIHNYELLNPFKSKPPLKDWFVLRADHDKWPNLARIALEKMRTKMG